MSHVFYSFDFRGGAYPGDEDDAGSLERAGNRGTCTSRFPQKWAFRLNKASVDEPGGDSFTSAGSTQLLLDRVYSSGASIKQLQSCSPGSMVAPAHLPELEWTGSHLCFGPGGDHLVFPGPPGKRGVAPLDERFTDSRKIMSFVSVGFPSAQASPCQWLQIGPSLMKNSTRAAGFSGVQPPNTALFTRCSPGINPGSTSRTAGSIFDPHGPSGASTVRIPHLPSVRWSLFD